MADGKRDPTTIPAQNLRFVVASDPAQFRDRSTLHSNRSHIMQNQRNKRQHRQLIQGSKTQKRSASATLDNIPGYRSRSSPSRHAQGPPSPKQVMSSADALSMYRRIQEPRSPQQRENVSIQDTNRSKIGQADRSSSPGSHSIPPKHFLSTARSGSAPEDANFSSLLRCRTEMYIPILKEMYAAQRLESDDEHYSTSAQDSGTGPTISVGILRYCCTPIPHL